MAGWAHRVCRTIVLVMGLAGCGGPPPAASRPRLAFFGLETRQLHADAKLVRRFEAFLPKLVEAMEGFRTVPQDEIRRHLRGKRGRTRACVEPPCQVRVGRELSASAALGVRIEKNLVQQCDVYAALYVLARSGADQRSRARAGCAASELHDSIRLAVCRVLVLQAGGTVAEQDAKHAQCLAAAELIWLDLEVATLRELEAVASPEGLVKEERRLAEQALALRARYQALQQAAPSPLWSVAAQCRSAGIYEAMAETLVRAGRELTVPRTIEKQGEAASRAFRNQIASTVEERARPLREQAAGIYRACLQRAESLKVTGKYPDEARRRLVAIEGRP